MSQSKKSKEIRRPQDAPAAEAQHEDDLIVVPKGTSRTRFYLLIGLTVFVLLVFVVMEPLMMTAGRRGDEDQAFMRWTGTGGAERVLSRADFMSEKRVFSYLDENMLQAMGLSNQRIQQDDEAARLIVMDDLARGWGIEITDAELAEQLRALFGPDLAGYEFYLRRYRTLTKAAFESALRRAMRIHRFELLAASGVAMADPDRVVELWQERQKEYAFDYVELESADFVEEARAELPEDEQLEVWLAGRNEVERSRFLRPERYTADAVYLPLTDEELPDGTLLFDRYPRPEDEDPLELAQNYYNRFVNVRFVRPEPLPETPPPGGEEGEGGEEQDVAGPPPPQDPIDERDRIYFTFDEVRERVLAEAPIHQSMQDWFNDLRSRALDGEVDLILEAADLGLVYASIDTPYTRQQWLEEVNQPWVGRFLVGAQGSVEPGQYVPRVVVEERALVVSRVLQRFPRALPPFEEIRDEVAEAWATAHAGKVALGKLEDLYEGMRRELGEDGEPTRNVVLEEERFREWVEGPGFVVRRRDYRGRFATPPPDELPTQLEAYLRVTSAIYAAEDGAVLPPGTNRTGTHSFLLRMAGRRDADLAQMKPDELSNLSRQVRQQNATNFLQDTYRSTEFLQERHGLWLRGFEE